MNTNDIKSKLKKVIAIESKASDNLSEAIDDSFVEAVKLIRNSKGKVIITGVGKSGHIGKKWQRLLRVQEHLPFSPQYRRCAWRFRDGYR